MKLGFVLAVPASVLRTSATALKLAANLGERLAGAIKGDAGNGTTDATPSPAPRQDRPAHVPAPAAVREEPGTPAAPLNVAALTSRPTPEVIAALDDLSATELADLYDRESRSRRRRAVLDAIQAAAAPPANAATPPPLPEDEVRVPDELVYSTQTPRR